MMIRKTKPLYLKVRLLALTSLLALSIYSPSSAAAASDMDSFDANHDGRITFEEVMKHLEPSVRKSFDTLDRNHDGVLSDNDFDDVREGIQHLEDWLQELIPPILRESEPAPQESVEL